MDIITKDELRFKKHEILDRIMAGQIFIYPTDTIYGIGCDARNEEAVKKIREIKQRPETPFSVLAPSLQWIMQHCEVSDNADEWLRQLPGPLTLIFNSKDGTLSKNIAPNLNTLGVRIPDHWFAQFITWADLPIVTTSVNIINENFMTSLEDLDPKIQQKVSFCIYEGEKEGRPSKIINLTSENANIKER